MLGWVDIASSGELCNMCVCVCACLRTRVAPWSQEFALCDESGCLTVANFELIMRRELKTYIERQVSLLRSEV